MSINRRDFLKRSALAAAAAAIGVDSILGNTIKTLDKTGEAGATQTKGSVAWHKSVCRLCGTGCGVMLGVKDGKPFGIKGDSENTINKGLLCVKGFYLHKIITAKNRLLYPMIRKNGKLERASWEEALNLV
ncbi:MAG: twin-arginine translocation signal domain-containing protein, partial [Bacteroidetes bacterium]|nr:twin-arginine translocation signal domain-containing protein [Bacteroidota bacterium]